MLCKLGRVAGGRSGIISPIHGNGQFGLGGLKIDSVSGLILVPDVDHKSGAGTIYLYRIDDHKKVPMLTDVAFAGAVAKDRFGIAAGFLRIGTTTTALVGTQKKESAYLYELLGSCDASAT